MQADCEEERGDRGEGGSHEEDERPRQLPAIMLKVIHEIAHDPTHDQAGDELSGAKAMEENARVMTGSSLRAPVEEHVGGLEAD